MRTKAFIMKAFLEKIVFPSSYYLISCNLYTNRGLYSVLRHTFSLPAIF